MVILFWRSFEFCKADWLQLTRPACFPSRGARRGEWAKAPMRRHKPGTPFDQLYVMIEAVFDRSLRRLPAWPENAEEMRGALNPKMTSFDKITYAPRMDVKQVPR